MDSLFVLSTTSGILAPIAKLLGIVMNAIYNFLSNFLNIQNIALTIIIFTLIVYLCMLPLTYQQQKFSKMSQIMQPELQAIQKKYKNRKDSASMEAQNAETQELYQKYGVRPSGSCVFMIIQLLILFPLYRVIYNVPGYVAAVKETFAELVNNIMATSGYQDIMTSFYETISENNSVMSNVSLTFDGTETDAYNSIIDVLYKCTSDNWSLLSDTFSGFSDVVTSTQQAVEHFNSFFGASIVYSPVVLIRTSIREGTFALIIVAIAVPLISLITQVFNIRLTNAMTSGSTANDQMSQQMKTMNYFMPIYSLIIVLFLPIGVGIYWIAGAVIRSIQQIILNRHFNKIDMEALVAKNQEKAKAKNKKKVEKKGVSGKQISSAAGINTRQIKTMKDKANSVKKGTASVSDDKNVKYKQGSLTEKARRVQAYNERNLSKKEAEEYRQQSIAAAQAQLEEAEKKGAFKSKKKKNKKKSS